MATFTLKKAPLIMQLAALLAGVSIAMILGNNQSLGYTASILAQINLTLIFLPISIISWLRMNDKIYEHHLFFKSDIFLFFLSYVSLNLPILITLNTHHIFIFFFIGIVQLIVLISALFWLSRSYNIKIIQYLYGVLLILNPATIITRQISSYDASNLGWFDSVFFIPFIGSSFLPIRFYEIGDKTSSIILFIIMLIASCYIFWHERKSWKDLIMHEPLTTST
jgi:hypothetical protein